MNILEAILQRRTIRRFKQDKIDIEILKKLVNGARLAPTGGNKQPWKFLIANDKENVDKIFPCLRWAAYLAPKGTPQEGERPTAYIIILINEKEAITPEADASSASMNIILGALEFGIGSCWIGAIDKKKLSQVIEVPEGYVIKYVIALGYPNESPIIEDVKDSIKYYKDENNVLHVPKKKLDDVLTIL